MTKPYKSVSLNAELIARVEQIVSNGSSSFTNVSQFVASATRRLCEQYESRTIEVRRMIPSTPPSTSEPPDPRSL